MKLKFKATKQDWIIFILFVIVLLFLVSIVVGNIHSFSTGKGFIGINPFYALSRYFATVLLLYFAVLGFLFYTTKDYFFDRSKGFGFSEGPKESKGFSRWCTDKEMKATLSELDVKNPHYDKAGFPIISNDQKFWVDDGESHNIVIGSTGTGKTQCIIHPLVKILTKKGESMIITDPKGEIYRESAGLLKKEGYQIIVLNFRDPQRGNCWNPLNLPYKLYKAGNTDKAMEILDDLASNILYDEASSNQDPFWEKTSADYFAGLALGLFEDGKEEEVNINSINLMTNIGEDKCGPRSTYIKEYFNMKDPASSAYTCASGTINAPDDTKNSILSTFRQKIRLFASRENLSEMLSQNDFDIDSIGKKKTAVFMIIQDEKKTYHALATIFIKQCYESLIDVAQHTDDGKLPVRTNFILDEFANMPPLKDITTMITAARSRQIRFTMIIQNFAQLDAVYGKENAQTIRSNCNNLLYLLTTELAALEEISKLCGDKMVKVGKGDKEREEARPLATVSDLQKMKQFEAIVIRTRLNPFKTRLKPNFEIDWGIKKIDADEFVQREKKPISVFDIREFVKTKKEEKMKEAGMNSNNPFAGMPNPFMNMGANNPFAGMPNNKPVPTPRDNNLEKTSNINIDDLVKKIDAKIAELEKEEEMEAKKLEEEKKNKEEKKSLEEKMSPALKDIAPTRLAGFMENAARSNEQANNDGLNPKPVTSSEVTKYKNVTDDEFFDDFFDE